MTTHQTRIKVCGITTREGIEAAISAGAHTAGLVLAESPRRITPEQAADLCARLPPFVTPTFVYRHPPEDLVRTVANLIPHATHQSDANDFADALSTIPRAQRLPVFRVEPGFEDTLDTFICSTPTPTVLVEGPRSGTGQLADWSRITPFTDRARIVLAGGLNPSNVAEAIRTVRPFAVDVSSGVESSPGVKDARLIHAFAEAVRAADATLNTTNP